MMLLLISVPPKEVYWLASLIFDTQETSKIYTTRFTSGIPDFLNLPFWHLPFTQTEDQSILSDLFLYNYNVK